MKEYCGGNILWKCINYSCGILIVNIRVERLIKVMCIFILYEKDLYEDEMNYVGIILCIML